MGKVARAMPLLLLVPLVILCTNYGSVTCYHDDGLWPLAVEVSVTSNEPIVGVTCEAFTNEGCAQDTFQDRLPRVKGLFCSSQIPFRDGKLTVDVPTSRRVIEGSLWTQSTSYFQYKTLVVVIIYSNGERSAVMVDIPDMRNRDQRRVSVTIQ